MPELDPAGRAASIAAPARVIHLIDPVSSRARPEAYSPQAVVLASSSGLGWDGLSVQIGRSLVFEPDHMSVAGYCLTLNLDPSPLQYEIKGAHGFQRAMLPSGGLWIQPPSAPFSQRNLGPLHHGIVQITPAKARRVLGAELAMRPMHGVLDERLAALMRLLLLEATDGGPSDPLYVDSIETALLVRLAGLSSMRQPEGSLGAARLKLVREFIEDQLAEPLTLRALSAVARVSPAHFAREWKRATGEAPHAYVMGRRVERARRLLGEGVAIADAAALCGFTDQAHLSRLFKRHVGVTPGIFVRQTRR